jgi:hypothetical protein
VAASARDHRLIEAGTDLDGVQQPNSPSNAFAVVDTRTYSVLARSTVQGSIARVAIDESNWLAYLAIGRLVTISPSDPYSSYHLELWRIDLHTGRVVSQILVYEGEPLTVAGIAVDTSIGRVLLTTTHNDASNDLFIIDPVSQALHLVSLEGIPGALFVDNVHHRAVVGLQLPAVDPAESHFAGFDTRSGRRVWSRTFAYGLRAYSTTFNALTRQVWYQAPGGLITVLSAATGQTIKFVQMDYSSPAGLGTAMGFVIDPARNVGYLRWDVTGLCTVDAASAISGSRHPIYQDHFSPCYNTNYDYATLMAVNEASGTLEIAGQTGMTLLTGNGRLLHQYAISDQSGLGPASSSPALTVLQNGAHSSLVLLRTVPHQDQITGAPSTGAVVFVPVL